MSGLNIVGYVYDVNKKHPDAAKVIKILDWLDLINWTKAQAFLGICVYYRIWIFCFAIIAEPTYSILKKKVEFVWGPDQAKVIYILKHKLVLLSAFISIDYFKNAGLIIFEVDTSLLGWSAILM